MSNSAIAIEYRNVAELRPSHQNARTHSKKQIRQIADSIERFGFTNPILITDEAGVIAGHGRLEAARLLGISMVPTVKISHLSEAERRAYVLADNKLALNAGWDREILAVELQALVDLEFDVDITGFSLAEIDLALDENCALCSDAGDPVDDEVPPFADVTVSRLGDLWKLGRHRLVCGDARAGSDFSRLLAGEKADLIFTDILYKDAVDGHLCATLSPREIAMGAGDMFEGAFTGFLTQTLGNAARACRDGAIAFVCTDWSHIEELLSAGSQAFSELKNLCVWNKTNGGVGPIYRSKHELVFVFKIGAAPHTNNLELGETGRYRTNVWDYASIRSSRSGQLETRPTIKPVALIADAIRDCTHAGETVLDCFGGWGSTLIAAEKTDRTARLIEFDPFYCDTIIRRFEALTGKRAHLGSGGPFFEDVAEQRETSNVGAAHEQT